MRWVLLPRFGNYLGSLPTPRPTFRIGQELAPTQAAPRGPSAAQIVRTADEVWMAVTACVAKDQMCFFCVRREDGGAMTRAELGRSWVVSEAACDCREPIGSNIGGS